MDHELEERHENIIKLNVQAAKRVLRRTQPGITDETVLLALHKARVELTAAPEDLRLESVEWLRERGYKRLNMMELPPKGVLPL